MQALAGARAEGLLPEGAQRDIVSQRAALEALMQVFAIVDQWYESKLLPAGKALHIMLMLVAAREYICPLPDPPGATDLLESDLREIDALLTRILDS
jgi:hypothetical protein